MPGKNRLLWLPGLLLVDILFLFATSRFGLGLPPDSAKYFSVAKSIVLGVGFRVFDGTLFCDAVPGYSLLLVPAYYLGLNPFIYAWALQFILIQVLAWLCWKLVLECIPVPNWKLLPLLLLIPFTFFPVYTEALSELPFLVLLMGWMYREIKDGKTAGDSWRISLLLALLVLFRYAGWMLIPGGIVYWVYCKLPWKHLLLRISLPVLVGLIWMWRVQNTCDSPFGVHIISEKFGPGLSTILMQAMDQGALRFIKQTFPLVLVIILIRIAFLKKNPIRIGKWVGMVTTGYFLALIYHGNLPLLQLPRFLSILFPILWLVPVYLLHEAKTKMLKLMLTGLLLIQVMVAGYKGTLLRHKGAGGFHTQEWQDNRIAQATRNLEQAPVMSNYPDMVWWQTGKECHYSPFLFETEEQFQARVGSGNRLLLWFNRVDRNHVMKADTAFVIRYPAKFIGSFGDARMYLLQLP